MKTNYITYSNESETSIAARHIAQQRRRRQEMAQAVCEKGSSTDTTDVLEADANAPDRSEQDSGDWATSKSQRGKHRLFVADDLRLALKHASTAETRRALADFDEMGSVRQLAPVPDNYAERCSELSEEFPQFSNVLFKKIVPELAIGKFGGQGIKFPHLCLQGTPGVGKTYFAKRLAEAFDLPFSRINLEGAQGGFCINGLDRSYSNHSSGEIVRFLTRGGCNNVVNGIIALEEVDKASGDSRYSVENTLIQLLEETTAKEFRDLSIPELKLDITPLNFIFTANIMENISAPVLSRLEKVELPDLTPDQSAKIASIQFKKLIKQLNLGAANLVLPELSLAVLCKFSPRLQKGLLRSAIGTAIFENQTQVIVQAPSKLTAERRQIGFF